MVMRHLPSNYRPPEIWMELIDRKRLAKLMTIQEVTALTLARAVGWKSRTSVVRLLDGSYNSVDPDKAARIAKFFGVGIDDLFVVKMSSETGDIANRRAS